MKIFLSTLVLFLFTTLPTAQAQLLEVQTIEEYNQNLIDFGVSWKAGSSVYYPSFYAGFAPKIENANRIHFHLGRGNQARLTATLDEQAVLAYLYNLQARGDFYNLLKEKQIIAPVGQLQKDFFLNILSSEVYGIQKTIQLFESGAISKAAFYSTSLEIMKRLNSGRTFDIKIDLRSQFLNWRNSELVKITSKTAGKDAAGIKSELAKNNEALIVVLNNLLPGRINLVHINEQISNQLIGLLPKVTLLSDEQFVEETAKLFNLMTQNRFQFQIIDQGQRRQALDCVPNGNCNLVYTEFTAIYPVGSVKSYTKDRDGNRIPDVAEEGSMNFIERSYHQVDHIRSEPFYGWMPKMDYTGSGNGIHNPAVRTSLDRTMYSWLYSEFNIPKTDDTLWVVARGGVSHGCTRMSAGHIQEVRQIFPSNPTEMTKLVYHGNHASDYDLFDIDGNGQLEVMGVDYLIAYALDADSGAGYREGNGFIDEALKKAPFYDVLYGKKQFQVQSGTYYFQNPYMSYFSSTSATARSKTISVRLTGNFELYEQAYEKDKLQFFNLPKLKVSSLASGVNGSNKTQQLIRLYGRINSCGGFKAEFPTCYEDQYKKEMNELLQKTQK